MFPSAFTARGLAASVSIPSAVEPTTCIRQGARRVVAHLAGATAIHSMGGPVTLCSVRRYHSEAQKQTSLTIGERCDWLLFDMSLRTSAILASPWMSQRSLQRNRRSVQWTVTRCDVDGLDEDDDLENSDKTVQVVFWLCRHVSSFALQLGWIILGCIGDDDCWHGVADQVNP